MNKRNSLAILEYHDELSGLYNRSFFEEEVKRFNTLRQLPISVIVSDINGLQRINDSMGLAAGDQIIKETTAILRSCCRCDDLIARWESDEFRIFLPKTDNVSVQSIIHRIHRAFKKCKSTMGTPINLSLGYATKHTVTEDMYAIFKQAETSMYKHKLLEKNSLHSSNITAMLQTQIQKNHEVQNHSQRLLRNSFAIGQALNLSEDYLNDLKLITLLHHVGSIGLSEKILSKPKNLDETDWEIIKKHPEMGYKIVKEAPHLAHVADSILYHHERWDGKGYPAGIAGNTIPLFSRILAVVDAYDAMTSPRAYRDVLSKDDAFKELTRHSGTQFDPTIVETFLQTQIQIG